MTLWFSALIGATALAWFYAVVRLGRLNEMHHAFYGMWAIIGAYVYGSLPVAIAGYLVLLDDAYQHVRQLSDPSYRSPLWKLYAFLYPVLPKWMRL